MLSNAALVDIFYSEGIKKAAAAVAVAEGESWITVNGQHILIGADGFPKAGNPQVFGDAKQLPLPFKSTTKVTPTKERAWKGEKIEVKTKLIKDESGKIGERAVLAYLHSQGLTDARPLNEKHSNYPIDMVQDHQAIEIKTGMVSSSTQKWRATIGEPGKAEKAWLSQADKTQKSAWNLRKMDAVMERKQNALKELTQERGHVMKAYTMTTHLNPDTKTIDIYKFEGFHRTILWNSPAVSKAYVGSFKYHERS